MTGFGKDPYPRILNRSAEVTPILKGVQHLLSRSRHESNRQNISPGYAKLDTCFLSRSKLPLRINLGYYILRRRPRGGKM